MLESQIHSSRTGPVDCMPNSHRWRSILDDGARPVGRWLIERANTPSGGRVLDLACGHGDLTLALLKQVGPRGEVVAVDKCVSACRQLRQELAAGNFRNAKVLTMDANTIGQSKSGYDAVFCKWGLMFLGELHPTLTRIRRCIRRGGAFVAAVWGPDNEVPLISLAERAVRTHLAMPPAHTEAGNPFVFANSQMLMKAIRDAGFRKPVGEWLDLKFKFAHAADFVDYQMHRSRDLRQALACLAPREREVARRAITDAVREYEVEGKEVSIRGRTFCVACKA